VGCCLVLRDAVPVLCDAVLALCDAVSVLCGDVLVLCDAVRATYSGDVGGDAIEEGHLRAPVVVFEPLQSLCSSVPTRMAMLSDAK
jgi:hypothetical protein